MYCLSTHQLSGWGWYEKQLYITSCNAWISRNQRNYLKQSKSIGLEVNGEDLRKTIGYQGKTDKNQMFLPINIFSNIR